MTKLVKCDYPGCGKKCGEGAGMAGHKRAHVARDKRDKLLKKTMTDSLPTYKAGKRKYTKKKKIATKAWVWCPYCGWEFGSDDKFCSRCGAARW